MTDDDRAERADYDRDRKKDEKHELDAEWEAYLKYLEKLDKQDKHFF